MSPATEAPSGHPDELLAIEPYRLRRPSPTQLAGRATETLRVLRRRFITPLLARQALRGNIEPAEIAAPLRRAFRDLGGTYVKLGQLVASVPGLLGDEVSAEFRSLLDEGRRLSFRAVRRQVERGTGQALEQSFADFDPEPLGRASVAVVHRATLHDGRVVAVKVLRPGIEATISSDLELMGALLPQIAERVDGADPAIVKPILRGLRSQLCEELDLGNEARTQDLVRGQCADSGLDLVAVPAPIHDLSSRRVLVMDYLDGVAIDDIEAVHDYGYDPAPVVEQLVKLFLLTAIRDGFFHGDLHAGNLLLLSDGRLGVIDWGIVGRFEPRSLARLRLIIRAVLGDEEAWTEVLDWATSIIGPTVLAELPLDEQAIRSLLRMMLSQIFSMPLGQLDLGSMLSGPSATIGAAPMIDLDPETFDRGLFLVGKQLLFYERYAKHYLPDRALLDDREFFAALVARP